MEEPGAIEPGSKATEEPQKPPRGKPQVPQVRLDRPEGRSPDDLEGTWWVHDREPGMDDIYEQAGASLEEMISRLEMYPFQDTGGNPRLFLARFEIPAFEEEDGMKYGEALYLEEARGFMDFMTGFPIGIVEMLGTMGEHSLKEEDLEFYKILPGGGASPPVPEELFQGIPEERLLLNVLFFRNELVIQQGRGRVWVRNLEGEAEPAKLHWWVRTNFRDEDEFPLPGEFMGLAVRIMPGNSWGRQLSSPFIYSGNWLDTVFLTSAVVQEVIEPDDDFPFPRYKVQWRKEEEVEVYPSDFAEYQVGDRVTILKAVDEDKVSQTWKDEDMQEFDSEKWVIVPISFYREDEED